MITRNRKSVLSTVTPATGGTQSNELQAAIKSVTSSITVGAVFLYDTSQDSDGGKWRKKTSHTSWAREASSATRSARSEFPAMALIVADSVSGVTIYDLDDPAMPTWMVFNGLSGNYDTKMLWASGNAAGGGLFALNGRVFLGRTWVDFSSDEGGYHHTSSPKIYTGGIGDRNGTTLGGSSIYGTIVNNTVNDVAATWLEGGELDSMGLVRPVVACATAGGVSVIHPSGDVFDQTHTVSSDNKSFQIFWDNKGGLYWSTRDISSAGTYFLYQQNPLYADSSAITGVQLVTSTASGALSAYPYFLGSSAPYVNAMTSRGDNELAVGNGTGLSLYKNNTGNFNEGMVSYHTSSYATGYMVGDIRFAGLANNKTDDKSVKANTLTQVGTIGNSNKVATGAELIAYDGFSASNYLSKAHDADFDFGTGDFSIMFWHKLTQASVDSTSNPTQYEDTISRTDATSEAGDWLIQKQPDESLLWKRHNGSSWASIKTSSASKVGTEWTLVCAVRRNGMFNWYYNGVYDSSVADTNSYTPSGGSALVIGRRLDASFPATGASLSLLRISATAPTPKQIADIYAAEKPLFQAGAKCLLQGGGDIVDALSYDKSTSLLTAACGVGSLSVPGSTIFRGLEAVSTFWGSNYGWPYNSTKYITTVGGVSSYVRTGSGGGVLVDLPSVDVRAELNEGESKLPDDGKLHFSGITTSNGGDVIAHIPIAEEENVTVNAHVTAKGYGADLGTHYANYILTEQFYRAAGGDVTSAVAETSIVSQESAAGLDATLGVDTSADTAKITVTGDASDRVVWTASVEVIRDSEKYYER